MSLEKHDIVVEAGVGYILGSFLRQWAARADPTWEAIGYRIAPRSTGFGLSGDQQYSVLEVLKGKLVVEPGVELPHSATGADGMTPLPAIMTFDKSGDCFVNGPLKITGLSHLNIQTIEVAIIYGRGTRPSEENYRILEEVLGSSVRDFIVIPSNHGETCEFKFTVTSDELSHDVIHIQATPGSLKRAIKSASNCLTAVAI